MDKYYNNMLELMLNIKKRPGMFLGINHYTNLIHFLNGVIFSMKMYNIDYGMSLYDDFMNWADKKYAEEIGKLSIRWDTNLVERLGSEEAAFDLFFEEFELYLKENNIEIPIID